MFAFIARRRALAAAATVLLVVFGSLTTATAASAAPTPDIVVVTPAVGTVLTTTDFTLAGTAPIGTQLVYEIRDGSGTLSAATTADADGAWSFTVHLPRGIGPIDIVVIGVTAGGGMMVPATITVTAAPLLAAPVVLAPAEGSTVTSNPVTVSGTTEPNSIVRVAVLQADYPSDLPSGDGYVVSDSTGAWSTSYTLPNANYIAFVYLSAEANDDFAESLSETAIAEFTVAVAAATPAALPPLPAELAATGGEPIVPTSIALLLLLAGAAALVLSRRRGASAAIS